MANASTYSVIVSGKLKDEFDPAKIQEALATLLKVPPEKAANLMRREWIIKKGVDQQTAAVYKKKLESIGLIIGLKEHAPPSQTDGGLSLALEPTAEEQKTHTQEASPETADPKSANCPKCGAKPLMRAEQCQDCGTLLNSVLKQSGDKNNIQNNQAQEIDEEENDSLDATEENLTSKSIAAGAAAALLGAIVWNIIGNVFDYELGIVAWGIGGAVGYAVAVTGSSGDKAAMICAALALFAILGGKYMLYSGFKDDLSQIVADNKEEIQGLYDYEMQTAAAFANVTDDESLRQFMVYYEYTESDSPENISDEEIEAFQTDIEPALVNMINEQPDFDKWVQTTLQDTVGEISTMDIMKENFGILDIIFLFLGVGTAFRLGRGTTA